jgi:hypothetical protein
MNLRENTVFILGAGFTKAFVPSAPLLVDDYDTRRLLRKYECFQHVRRIIETESAKHNGKIDLERTMTRLSGQMPYDREHGASDEFTLLLSDIKNTFIRKLKEAKSKELHSADLVNFARLCRNYGITCITFNYDDILDEALLMANTGDMTEGKWHPNGGYGFFCRPSSTCITNQSPIYAPITKESTTMFLLKLHGSMSWRIRRGYAQPYPVDAIVHHANWIGYDSRGGYQESSIGRHLEQEPFMVPPILTKESLITQPVLRLIWSLAFDILSKAAQVVFIGYSFPITDIASSYLFQEAIPTESEIHVVNIAESTSEKAKVIEAYRNVLPRINDNNFDFRDARIWAQEVTSQNNLS